jgi:transposase-like protein
MSKTHRRRRGDQFWRDTIAAWKESGQSVTAFCAARGIGESTFFAKRRALRGRSPHAPSASAPGTSFTAVRVISDPTIEIVVPGGVVLRISVGADAAAVARLVLALRGAPC